MTSYMLYCLAIVQLVACAPVNNFNLKSVYVVFRHGDRTPELRESYKSDPYFNYTYYPIGRGGLTNQGKIRLYNLGSSLRQRYDNFLGKYYLPKDVKARSTDTYRTKMSLELVLASLYPPTELQLWKNNLNWQPIPYYAPRKEQDPFFGSNFCPIYKKLIKEVRESPKYLQKWSQFSELAKNLSRHTGQEVKDSEFVYLLYHQLVAESALNMTLPNWTKEYFPDGILNATLFEYDTKFYTDALKGLFGGMSIRKILDDFSVVTNEQTIEKPKIHLQAAHEDTVVSLLNFLNLWKRTVPEYTSGVIFELYEANSDYFIKLAYYKGIPSEYDDELQIPGCDKFCPLEKFKNMFKDFIPTNVREECYGSEKSFLDNIMETIL